MKRPLAVTIIGWLLVVVGASGFVLHLYEGKPQHALEGENPWILATELVAVVGGAFLLRGKSWARWVVMAWMAFHVAISFNSPRQLVIHGAIFVLFAYFLFRPATVRR
ncbi:MAG TPA: hypothetical protein VK807_01785 [Gemmatimonadaceae bacterium]|jgi:hypothetical protein|nr:hypothetical protein [Gemmatimonadaceae bacterium]